MMQPKSNILNMPWTLPSATTAAMGAEIPDIANAQIPYSEEAERALISVVFAHKTAYYEANNILKAGDFFLVRHQIIWETFDRLAARDEPIQYMSVLEDLRGRNKLEDTGGVAYLTQLIDCAPLGSTVGMLAELVLRPAIRRRMLCVSDAIRQLALDGTITTEDAQRAAQSALADVTTPQQQRELVSIREAVSQFYDQLQDMEKNGRAQSIPTGLKSLDDLLDGGLYRKKLVLLAGRPGMGKTATMLTIAMNAARLGARVAFFTMEMSQTDILRRIMAAETGIPLSKLKTGENIQAGEWVKLTEAMGRLAALKTHLYIDSSQSFTPHELYSKCRLLNDENGLDLVIVDYIALMGAPNHEKDEFTKITYLSNCLRWIKDSPHLNACFLVASQLNRNLEARQDKRPVKSDLRDSGRLEENADAIIFLFREKEYNKLLIDDVAEFIVDKHRDGATGTATARFLATVTKFVNM